MTPRRRPEVAPRWTWLIDGAVMIKAPWRGGPCPQAWRDVRELYFGERLVLFVCAVETESVRDVYRPGQCFGVGTSYLIIVWALGCCVWAPLLRPCAAIHFLCGHREEVAGGPQKSFVRLATWRHQLCRARALDSNSIVPDESGGFGPLQRLSRSWSWLV